MKLLLRILCIVGSFWGNASLFSQAIERRVIDFGDNWAFQKIEEDRRTQPKAVSIPHTWNALDAQEGIPYFRGEAQYSKKFVPDNIWRYKRVFLRFEGVMSSAKVYLNGKLLGNHQGGYSAFAFEITSLLEQETTNVLEVEVSNRERMDILPLVGDFNLYGGIYRPVSLIITDRVCVSPLNYASSGIYLHPTSINPSRAEIQIEAHLSQGFNQQQPIGLRATIRDRIGRTVFTDVLPLFLPRGDTVVSMTAVVDTPHLWQGRLDPYLYQVTVDIYRDYRRVDRVTETLGLRTYSVDAQKGFSLNGEPLRLQGVSRHQDRQDKGSAISRQDHQEDMRLMEEMGVNAIRLAHYQQAETIYDLADSAGMVVWAEIPWIGIPDLVGNGSNGYEATSEFHHNAEWQLLELIHQNYNHPSICFWGIFNEIQNPEESSPVGLITYLDSVARAEDPYRLTTGASMLEPEEPIHDITDVIAWNKYFGWYYHPPQKLAEWLDNLHSQHPNWKIGISEYGAGASIHQHSQKRERPNPFGSPHPEEWQNYYHEVHWKIIQDRPYLWGTFVWNMFDFGSHFRREGDHAGINDKGLVTFDRKTKKDAFYFYKANWQKDPVLYISSRRHIFREKATTPIRVYSNLDEVSLVINGQDRGIRQPQMGIATWEDQPLQKGKNSIVVQGSHKGVPYSDEATWVLESGLGLHSLAMIFEGLTYLFPSILLIGFLSLISGRFAFKRVKGFENRRRNRWKKRLWRILFFFLLVLLILLTILYVYLTQNGLIT